MASQDVRSLRVLVVGESWIKHTIHIKGFDSFQTSSYEEGAGLFLDSLKYAGFDVTYIRAHEVSLRFPSTAEELDEFDVIVLSDIGANSFLLTDATFVRSDKSADRLVLVADFVRNGGGMLMVGGYMSFSGIDGKARYKMSALADVLPVEMLDHDDRVECPAGVVVEVDLPDHRAIRGVKGTWPGLLGFNRVVAKPGAETVSRCGTDPLLVVQQVGSGRSVAFTSDLAPHWAPPDFLDWEHYGQLWLAILTWASGVDPMASV